MSKASQKRAKLYNRLALGYLREVFFNDKPELYRHFAHVTCEFLLVAKRFDPSQKFDREICKCADCVMNSKKCGGCAEMGGLISALGEAYTELKNKYYGKE